MVRIHYFATMNTLERLNASLIKILSKASDIDQPYIHMGDKTYTKRDLMNALENNDPLADKLIDNLLMLTWDLLDRKKVKNDDIERL